MKLPNSLPQVLASLHAAVVLFVSAAVFTYSGASFLPLVLIKMDYPVSLLLVRAADALHDLFPSDPGRSFVILFLVLGSFWYGFIGWLLKVVIIWTYGKIRRDNE